MRWTVLIPVKALPDAKTRLVTTDAAEGAHAALVDAIRADTIAAAVACHEVARVVIVVDKPPRTLLPMLAPPSSPSLPG